MKIHVVRTGVANLASVLAALERAGAEPVLASDADEIGAADRLVLPGVGAFGAAMGELRRLGIVEALQQRIRAARPTLTVCLGLQLLAASSEESPGEAGLGVVDAAVTRFQGEVRVPQMGWNDVQPEPGARWVRPGFAWFANTFKLDRIPAGWTGAMADHGGSFVAAIERGEVLACQFHPELSGAWGAELLRRWVGGRC
ncbi:imidazole glycerol phosphate synthase subunit HisH [Deltaproteobacteria bacterium]|nr:imidazole glycerol phosphate synthase subunit HisH [Deltaproteobacteria bacterium]